MLFTQLSADLITSMKAKDELRTSVLRFLISALKNEKIAKQKPELDDEEVVSIVRKQVKQHEDSVTQFRAGGRPELADKEEAEIKILKQYLPPEMSEDAVRAVVLKIKGSLGLTDKSQAGRLMGEVMKELKGQAGGAMVKAIVEEGWEMRAES